MWRGVPLVGGTRKVSVSIVVSTVCVTCENLCGAVSSWQVAQAMSHLV